MIHVLVPGLRSTVQDAGRYAHLRSAVPPAGPADPYAFAAANALVGNPPQAAAIEVVGPPFRFFCDDTRLIAVTGRDVTLRGSDDVPGWMAVVARAGSEVEVRGGARSRFAYVAVSGGIDVPPVLGSCSTYLPAALGPVPRPLGSGDSLPLGQAAADARGAGRELAAPDDAAAVRAVRGPHDDRFDPEAVRCFFDILFEVTATSDRMGVRLVAPRPVRGSQTELLTCATVAGAVQVPPGGQPIVLLADHQTTGGYPIVATVILADLGLVARRCPGETLEFYEVDRERAADALREERRRLDSVR